MRRGRQSKMPPQAVSLHPFTVFATHSLTNNIALSAMDITSTPTRPTFLSLTLKPTTTPTSTNAWQLPAYDLRNEKKYLYPLHSLDIYFFTPSDAQDFLQAFSHVSTPKPVVNQPTTSAYQQASVRLSDKEINPSTIVANLEKAAATDPPFQHALHGPGSPRAPIPPEAAVYKPLTYNPSAPAKPEAIAYRERTPPPPLEGDVGRGVYVGQMAHTPLQQQQQYSMPTSPFAGPPTRTSSFPPPPPPSAPVGSGFPSPAPAPSQQQQQQQQQVYATYTPSYPPQSQPQSHSPQPFHPAPPLPQQQTHLQSPGSSYPFPHVPTPTPTTLSFPPAPIPSQQQNPAEQPYSIHASLYIPTSAELSAAEKAHNSSSWRSGTSAANGETNAKPPGKLELRAEKVERGVNRFLKRLDGRF